MTKLAYIKHRVVAGIRDEGGIFPALAKSLRLITDGGFKKLLLGDSYHLTPMEYAEWVAAKDTLSQEQVLCAREQAATFALKPKFSIIIPCYKTPVAYLSAAVESVRSQIYPEWEICLADDASGDRNLEAYLKQVEQGDRVRVVRRTENGHISACSNSALDLATGEWVVPLDHDDELSIDALLEIARVINEQPELQMIYSDEDKLDSKGRRARPYFKPQFNQELLRQNNYICHLVAYRRQRVVDLGGFRLGFEGAQDHDLALRYSESLTRDQICHIPKILYHWREHSGSTATGIGVKAYALEAGQRAIEQHLDRVNLAGNVAADSRGYYRLTYQLPEKQPSVAIIIPTRNQLELLRSCVDSIREKTTYKNYTILIVDNDSDCADTIAWLESRRSEGIISLLEDKGSFNFSRLNNYAVNFVDSDYVVLLNNDTEVVAPDWLSDLVATALQPDVGAVGGKLLYTDGSIQHAGVTLGIGGSAGHAFKGMSNDNPGYWFRAALRSEFTAVTGACLLVSREHYLNVGGLNEVAFAIAFNDVDFCLKLASRGLRNVLCPNAVLVHHESKSRGYEDTPEKAARFSQERTRLRQKWFGWIENDPCYNPNLNRDTEFFGHDWRFSTRTSVPAPALATPDDLDALSQLVPSVSAGLIALLKAVLFTPRAMPPVVILVGPRLAPLAAWLELHEGRVVARHLSALALTGSSEVSPLPGSHSMNPALFIVESQDAELLAGLQGHPEHTEAIIYAEPELSKHTLNIDVPTHMDVPI